MLTFNLVLIRLYAPKEAAGCQRGTVLPKGKGLTKKQRADKGPTTRADKGPKSFKGPQALIKPKGPHRTIEPYGLGKAPCGAL